MEHGYIREHEIVSLYAMNKLPPEERIAFEEHLLDCSECQDELMLTDQFRGALREAMPSYTSVASPLPRARVPVWAAAAMALLLCGVAMLVILSQRRGFQRQLADAYAVASQWEHRYRSDRQARPAPPGPLTNAPAQTAPLFTLSLTRGGAVSDEPANIVTISPSANTVVLALDCQNRGSTESYRARLTDASSKVAWSADRIAPPLSGALAITLPAALLQPGKYLLALESLSSGRYSVDARYSFRVTYSK